ncbi:MAG: hypothetical protein MUC94_14225 [bacterium]|jgi:DNA-binding NarL/FixJ family response regulator|nr:hypothetical protein [bacterium]
MPNQFTALIVDDERLARKDLISTLPRHPNINVVGEADYLSTTSITKKKSNFKSV